jgi:hypothetical protein
MTFSYQNQNKFPVAAADLLLSWLRSHEKDGGAILAMLRSEEFLHGRNFDSWRKALRAETAAAAEIRGLLAEYGVDVGKLLADSSGAV